MTTGCPPSSATPASKETRVRSDCFSKITATARGPASGRCPYRSAFKVAARSSTSDCSAGVRSSSRRKCLTTVVHPGVVVLVQRAGGLVQRAGRGLVQRRGQGGEEGVDLGGAQDQRRRA